MKSEFGILFLVIMFISYGSIACEGDDTFQYWHAQLRIAKVYKESYRKGLKCWAKAYDTEIGDHEKFDIQLHIKMRDCKAGNLVSGRVERLDCTFIRYQFLQLRLEDGTNNSQTRQDAAEKSIRSAP